MDRKLYSDKLVNLVKLPSDSVIGNSVNFQTVVAEDSLEIEVRKASLKACGHLFSSRADYMCNTSAANDWPLDLILHETLHEASDSQLKLQSLQNLNDFFRKDENFGGGEGKKINISVQEVNGQTDTSNISSAIAQA